MISHYSIFFQKPINMIGRYLFMNLYGKINFLRLFEYI